MKYCCKEKNANKLRAQGVQYRDNVLEILLRVVAQHDVVPRFQLHGESESKVREREIWGELLTH